jgi:hypothetical protein
MAKHNDLLPTSEDVLVRLAHAILPSALEPMPERYELEFLHALFDLRYQREPEIDLGRAFFDYFCRDADNGIIADLLKQHPDCEDIISDRLESYYSDVEADPQTGEPRGVPEFGVDAGEK